MIDAREVWMRTVGLAAVLMLLIAPLPALAGQRTDAPRPPRLSSPDFLFGPPKATIAIRGGVTFPQAGSDWYDFVTSELTLDKRDFRTVSIGADVVVMLPIPIDLVLAGDYGGTTQESEFRYWVDNNRLPIEQTTRIRQSTLTAGVRYALLGRGRQVSSLAWVPRRFAPYVGAGFGGLHYDMLQEGDFVDFRTLEVFADRLASSGWSPATYVNGGLDVHMTGQLYVTVDARYLWAEKALRQPWRSFEDLDLSGLKLSTGINILF